MSRIFWDANSEAGSGTAWILDTPNDDGRIYRAANHMADAIDYAMRDIPATTATNIDESEVDEPLTAQQMREIASRFDEQYNFLHRPTEPVFEMPLVEEPSYNVVMSQWPTGLRFDANKIVQVGGGYDAVFEELKRLDNEDVNKKVHDIIKGLLTKP